MTKLVIFDLDGTLLNTIDDLAVSTNYALTKHGFPEHPISAYNFFVGNGIRKLVERALPENKRDDATVKTVLKDFVSYYDKHSTVLTRPYDGIKELMVELTQSGISMAVASNKYQAATEELVEKYFGEFEFVEVLGQRDGIAPKPDPVIVEDILEKTNVEKEAVLFVGDSGVDMQTAINAEVSSVAVSWGFRPIAELNEFSPDFMIDSPKELLSIIK
ncbi:MAG: HAD family hydrolase [Bacteroidales bacterium]